MGSLIEAGRFVSLVEKRLGWHAKNDFARRATLRRVAEKLADDPVQYCRKNLQLAVELLAREQETRSPLGVFAHVPRALEAARDTEDDLEVKIREAMRIESHRGDPDGWVVRFARAAGWWRAEAYKEWRSGQAKPR